MSYEVLANDAMSEHAAHSKVKTQKLQTYGQNLVFREEMGNAYEVMEDRDVDSEEIFVKNPTRMFLKDSETKHSNSMFTETCADVALSYYTGHTSEELYIKKMSEKDFRLENKTLSMNTAGQSFTDGKEHKSGESSTFAGNTEDTTRLWIWEEGLKSGLLLEDLAKDAISEQAAHSFQSQASTLMAEFRIFGKEVGKAWDVMEDSNVDREEISVKNKFVGETMFSKDSEKKHRITDLGRDPSLLSSDTDGILTEWDDHTDLENSPLNSEKELEYNSNNIQQIFITSTGRKLELILYFTTIAQHQNRQHILATDTLIGKIQQYIITQNKSVQNYLAVDCNCLLVNTAYLAKLHYSNKHQIWKLDIRPLVNYHHVANQERVHLTNQLEDIMITVWGIKRYYDTNIKSAHLEQTLRYVKLIIKYPVLNLGNFQQYKSELNSITSSSPSSYIEQHCEESRFNTKNLNPPHLSSNTNADMLESVELSKDNGMIKRLRARASQDLNNPQRSTSGIQMQGQKRVSSDASSQPSFKNACISKSTSRRKRGTCS